MARKRKPLTDEWQPHHRRMGMLTRRLTPWQQQQVLPGVARMVIEVHECDHLLRWVDEFESLIYRDLPGVPSVALNEFNDRFDYEIDPDHRIGPFPDRGCILIMRRAFSFNNNLSYLVYSITWLALHSGRGEKMPVLSRRLQQLLQSFLIRVPFPNPVPGHIQQMAQELFRSYNRSTVSILTDALIDEGWSKLSLLLHRFPFYRGNSIVHHLMGDPTGHFLLGNRRIAHGVSSVSITR